MPSLGNILDCHCLALLFILGAYLMLGVDLSVDNMAQLYIIKSICFSHWTQDLRAGAVSCILFHLKHLVSPQSGPLSLFPACALGLVGKKSLWRKVRVGSCPTCVIPICQPPHWPLVWFNRMRVIAMSFLTLCRLLKTTPILFHHPRLFLLPFPYVPQITRLIFLICKFDYCLLPCPSL